MEIRRDVNGLFTVTTDHKSLETPFFAPAISSVRSNFSVEESLDLIKSTSYPGYLVSAYDLHAAEDSQRKSLIQLVSESTEGRAVTFLDSGYYEAFWYHDSNWTINTMETVLNEIRIDFGFSSDVFWRQGKPMEEHVSETITAIAMTAGIQRSGITIPILHSEPAYFPKLTEEIVEGIGPEVIGVPERELGSTLFERAETVKAVRRTLDGTGRKILLHLLGTGNPISILVYTLCGADTYDGQEWSQTVVDRKTAHLYHFIQRELLDCTCDACRLSDIAYQTQTISHNLGFYRDFTKEIRQAIETGQTDVLLGKYLDASSATRVRKIIDLP